MIPSFLELIELDNFWLPLIWVAAAGIVLYRMPLKTELIGDQVVQRWYGVSAVLLCLPLLLWAAARTDYGDTYAYMRHFYQAPASLSALPSYLAANTKDQGFTVIITLCKAMGVASPRTFFLIIAAVQMLCMIYTFRKYSKDFWISIFLFVASTDYMSWMYNGIRQFLATTLIFAAFGLMVRKKNIPFILVVILASRIHASALLMIPLAYFMQGPAVNRKAIIMIAGVVMIAPFMDTFMPALSAILADTQYSDITTDEIWTNDDGTNIIRVLVYSVPALLSLFGRKYIHQSKDPVMNMCSNASLITMALYLVSAVTSGVYIGRLPIYTTLHGYIVLPWLIDQIFEKSSAILIKLLMVGFYSMFYIYQMSLWELI